VLLTGPADVTGYDGLVTERVRDGIVPEPSDWLADMPSADPPRPAGTDSARQAGADPPRPPESDPAAAELRDRMERLPPGHPSSPYRGDGSRKPPEPDQSDREYPIPGDPDYRSDTPGTPDAAEVELVTMASDTSLDRDSEPPADATPDRDPETPADATPDRDLETPADASSDRNPQTSADTDTDRHLQAATDPVEPGDVPPDVKPLTDTEYAEHVWEVRERLDQAQAAGLATDDKYTIDDDGELWLEEREVFQDAIVKDLYAAAADITSERRAIMAGGLPGAGKTTVLETCTEIDRSRFLTINPDDIKEEMAQRGLIPHVEGLSPMEASDLVHEECSLIAKRLANVAQAEGKNIIWDITMSSRSTTEQRINELRSNGYAHIEGIFVNIPTEACKERAEARHRVGHEEYRAGKGEGGRLIPEDLIDRNSDPVWGSSSRRTFEDVKHRFDRWSLYDNSGDGLPPALAHSSETEKRQR
jgi:predicted ABC-type ATPase